MADDVFLQSYAGTIAPGDLFAIYRRGRSIACIAASTDLEIVINDGSRSKFFSGMALNFDRDFEKVQIYNPSGAPATFEITTAMGRVDDNRLTASGNLNVLDPVTGDSFAEVIAGNADILAMLQNADAKRAGVNVAGSSFFAANSVNTTPLALIDPSSNTNGAILRFLTFTQNTSVGVSFFISSSAPASQTDTSVLRLMFVDGAASLRHQFAVAPLFIPAGFGLYIVGNGSGASQYQGGYDLL